MPKVILVTEKMLRYQMMFLSSGCTTLEALLGILQYIFGIMFLFNKYEMNSSVEKIRISPIYYLIRSSTHVALFIIRFSRKHDACLLYFCSFPVAVQLLRLFKK